MAATSTLRQVLIELVERYGLGVVVPVGSNTTTTFTLTTTGSPELRGPFSSKRIPIGTPVLCSVETSGTTALGNRTYVSNWEPSTGVLTVSPAIGDTDVTEIILLNGDVRVGDSDRLVEAVNRALQNRLGRWEMRPLTFVPDGDLQGATVTDYWTAAANGTAAYATAQVFPAGSAADAVGQVGLNRLVQLTTSGGASTVTGNGIRAHASTQQRTWYFLTAIRLVSGSGTAEFKVRDNTNAADIALTVTRGNDTNTLTTTTLGDFMVCEGTFQLPATCAELAPQLSLSATGLVAQMGPVIMFPQGAMSFPLPSRIEADESIGNFYWGWNRRAPGGYADLMYSDPLSGGLEHRLTDYGDHRTVTFNFPAVRPVWFQEYVNGSSLTAMTDTTNFPLDRLVKWAYAELCDRMMRGEMLDRPRLENGMPIPSTWRPLRNAAYKSARYGGQEPALLNVVGRR